MSREEEEDNTERDFLEYLELAKDGYATHLFRIKFCINRTGVRDAYAGEDH